MPLAITGASALHVSLLPTNTTDDDDDDDEEEDEMVDNPVLSVVLDTFDEVVVEEVFPAGVVGATGTVGAAGAVGAAGLVGGAEIGSGVGVVASPATGAGTEWGAAGIATTATATTPPTRATASATPIMTFLVDMCCDGDRTVFHVRHRFVRHPLTGTNDHN